MVVRSENEVAHPDDVFCKGNDRYYGYLLGAITDRINYHFSEPSLQPYINADLEHDEDYLLIDQKVTVSSHRFSIYRYHLFDSVTNGVKAISFMLNRVSFKGIVNCSTIHTESAVLYGSKVFMLNCSNRFYHFGVPCYSRQL